MNINWHIYIYIHTYHIISYHILARSVKNILEPDVLQTTTNHLVAWVSQEPHISHRTLTFPSGKTALHKPIVVLGIFPQKSYRSIYHSPMFPDISYVCSIWYFNDPLRLLPFPLLFPCIPTASPWVLQWDRRCGWPPPNWSLVPQFVAIWSWGGGTDMCINIYIYLSIQYT